MHDLKAPAPSEEKVIRRSSDPSIVEEAGHWNALGKLKRVYMQRVWINARKPTVRAHPDQATSVFEPHVGVRIWQPVGDVDAAEVLGLGRLR